MAITRKAHWLYFKEADEFFPLIIEKVTNPVQQNAFSEKSSSRGFLVGTLASRKQAKDLSNKLMLVLVVAWLCLIMLIIKSFRAMRLKYSYFKDLTNS